MYEAAQVHQCGQANGIVGQEPMALHTSVNDNPEDTIFFEAYFVMSQRIM